MTFRHEHGMIAAIQACAVQSPDFSSRVRLVLIRLASLADQDGFCRHSLRHVAREFGLDVRDVRKALRIAERHKVLTTQTRLGRAGVLRLLVAPLEAPADPKRYGAPVRRERHTPGIVPGRGHSARGFPPTPGIVPAGEGIVPAVQTPHPGHSAPTPRARRPPTPGKPNRQPVEKQREPPTQESIRIVNNHESAAVFDDIATRAAAIVAEARRREAAKQAKLSAHFEQRQRRHH